MKGKEKVERQSVEKFDKYKQPFIILFTSFLLVLTFILACSIGLVRFRDLPKAAAQTVEDKTDTSTSIDRKDIFFQPLADKPQDNSADFTELTTAENAKIDSYLENNNYGSRMQLKTGFKTINRTGGNITWWLGGDIWVSNFSEVVSPLANEGVKNINIILNGYTIAGAMSINLLGNVNLNFYDKMIAEGRPSSSAYVYNANPVKYFSYDSNTKAYSKMSTTVPSGDDVTTMPSYTENSYIKIEGSAIAPSEASTNSGRASRFTVFATKNSSVNLFDINIVGLQNNESIFQMNSQSQLNLYRTNIIGNATDTLYLGYDVIAAIEIMGQAQINLIGSKVYGNATNYFGAGVMLASMQEWLLYDDIAISDKVNAGEYTLGVFCSNIGVITRYTTNKQAKQNNKVTKAVGLKDVNLNSAEKLNIDIDNFSAILSQAPKAIGCIQLIYNMSVNYNIANSNISFILHNYKKETTSKGNVLEVAGKNALIIGKNAQIDKGIYTINGNDSNSTITIYGKVNYVKATCTITIESGAWVNYLISTLSATILSGAKVGCFRTHGGISTIYNGATVGWVWLTQGNLSIYDSAKIGIVLFHKNNPSNKAELLDFRSKRPSSYTPQIDVNYNTNYAVPPEGTVLISNKDGNIVDEKPMPPTVPDLTPIYPDDMLPPDTKPDGPDNTPNNPDDILPPDFGPGIDDIIPGTPNPMRKYAYRFLMQWAMVDDKQMDSALDQVYDTYYKAEEAKTIEMYEILAKLMANNSQSRGLTTTLIASTITSEQIRAMIKSNLLSPAANSWIYGYELPALQTFSSFKTTTNSTTITNYSSGIAVYSLNQDKLDELKKQYKKTLDDLVSSLKKLFDLTAPYNEVYFLGYNGTNLLVKYALELLKIFALQDITDGYADGRITLAQAKMQARTVIRDINSRLYLGKEALWYTAQLDKEVEVLHLEAITPSATALELTQTQIQRRLIMKRLMRNMNVTINLDTYFVHNSLSSNNSSKRNSNNMIAPHDYESSDNYGNGGQVEVEPEEPGEIPDGPEEIPDIPEVPEAPEVQLPEIVEAPPLQNMNQLPPVQSAAIRGATRWVNENTEMLLNLQRQWNAVDAGGGDAGGGGGGGSTGAPSATTAATAKVIIVAGAACIAAGVAIGGVTTGAGMSAGLAAALGVLGGLLAAGIMAGIVYAILSGKSNNNDDNNNNDVQPTPPPQPEPPKDEIDFNGPFGGYDADDGFTNPEELGSIDWSFGGFQDPLDPDFSVVADGQDPDFGGFEGDLDLGFDCTEGADNIVPPDEQPVPPQPEPPQDEIDFNGPFGGFEENLDAGFTNPEGADNIVPPDDDDIIPTPPPVDIDETFGGYEEPLDPNFGVVADGQDPDFGGFGEDDAFLIDESFGGYDTDDSFSFDGGSQGGVDGGNGTLPDGSGTNTPTTPETSKVVKNDAGKIALFYSLLALFLLIVAAIIVLLILKDRKERKKIEREFKARMQANLK